MLVKKKQTFLIFSDGLIGCLVWETSLEPLYLLGLELPLFGLILARWILRQLKLEVKFYGIDQSPIDGNSDSAVENVTGLSIRT